MEVWQIAHCAIHTRTAELERYIMPTGIHLSADLRKNLHSSRLCATSVLLRAALYGSARTVAAGAAVHHHPQKCTKQS